MCQQLSHIIYNLNVATTYVEFHKNSEKNEGMRDNKNSNDKMYSFRSVKHLAPGTFYEYHTFMDDKLSALRKKRIFIYKYILKQKKEIH